MIYLYDNAIVDDLVKSFNPDNVPNPVVKVVPPEESINIAAQIQDDNIQFPIVSVTREPNTDIDNSRYNFSATHIGRPVVMNTETNDIYYERILPITLEYNLTCITTNTVDMDELERELLFKYTDMYYLGILLPYESKRQINFGVVIDSTKSIQRDSGTFEYLSQGQLYQTIIPLRCEGCVLVNNIPVKAKRVEHEIIAKP